MPRLALALVWILSGCDSAPAPIDDAGVAVGDAGSRDGGAPTLDSGAQDAAVPTSDGGVPSVSEALDCGRSGAGGLARGRDESQLRRVDIDLAAFPDAVCNDGTGAVMYVRPHSGPEHRHRWVIQLQGGGGCSSGQECANRWCRVDTNFGMNKMSAAGAPPVGIDGEGILARRTSNPYGGWNQVFVYYCSSDGWAGTGGARDVEVEHPTTGEPTPVRMHFNGHRIVEAVVGTLRRDAGAVVVDADGTAVELDDLDDAEEVALVGASAGGGGVINNLDWLRDTLAPAPVEGVIDSSFSPALEAFDYSETEFCSDDGLCDYESFLQFHDAARQALHAPASDASCLASHGDADAWRCTDTSHVVRHHLTTPFFVRMGLIDSQASDTYVERGFVPDVATFARWVRDDVAALADLATTAEEGAMISVTPGGFGIACDKHETLRSDSHTYDARLSMGGAAHAFPDALSAWRSGVAVSLVTDAPAMDLCPAR